MTADVCNRALIASRLSQAEAKRITTAYEDQSRIEYLQSQGVDFITFKDGRVLDVANSNNDLRGSVDGARFGDAA